MAGGTLGNLTVKLGLDVVEFTSGLTKAEYQGRQLGENLGRAIKAGSLVAVAGIAAIGTAAVGAAVGFQKLISAAGDFQDLSDMVGDSAENIASLQVAASTAGVGIDSVTASMIKLTKTLVGVDDESKAAGSALGAIGLNVEDFKRLDPVAQYEAVGKALAGYADGAGKTAVAVALFGKSGAEQLKVFKALEDQGGRSVILTAQQIAQADAYADKQAKVRAELALYAQQIATRILPAVTAFTGALTDTAKELLGVSKAASGLTDSQAIEKFSATGAVALASLADKAFAVVQVFNAVGESLGAAGAIVASLARGNFSGASAIAKAARETGDSMKFTLGLADKVAARIAYTSSEAGKAAAKLQGDPAELARRGRPVATQQIQFNGVAAKEKAAAKEKSDEGEKYLKKLQDQLDKTRELTTVETVLAEIQSGRLKLTGKVTQEQLVSLAKLIDTTKEATKVAEERAERRRKDDDDSLRASREIEESDANRLRSLLDGGPNAQLEKQLKSLDFLNEKLAAGKINQDQFNDAVQGLNLSQKLTEAKSLTDELGLSFTSAFEDAVVGGKGLSDVLKGLEADIIRIITRQYVTKPLGDALGGLLGGGSTGGGAGGFIDKIGGFIGGLFGGGRASGGPVAAGGLYRVAENGPEVLDVGGRQFLLNGSKSGMVRAGTPSIEGAGAGRAIVLNYHAAPGESRQTAQQRMALGARELALANRRGN